MITIDPISFDSPRQAKLNELYQIQDNLNELVQPGWKAVLNREDFQTAMIAEFGGEVLDTSTNIQWKHWKQTDPTLFNEFNLKIEVTDTVFFYLSVLILNGMVQQEDSLLDRFVGIDVTDLMEVGYIRGNRLDKPQYVDLFIDALKTPTPTIVDRFVSGAGMSSEEFSAFYVSKEILNRFRQSSGYQDGTYVKVESGIEDNSRLQPLIEEFLGSTTMTLNDLRENVVNEFYEHVV